MRSVHTPQLLLNVVPSMTSLLVRSHDREGGGVWVCMNSELMEGTSSVKSQVHYWKHINKSVILNY